MQKEFIEKYQTSNPYLKERESRTERTDTQRMSRNNRDRQTDMRYRNTQRQLFLITGFQVKTIAKQRLRIFKHENV